MVAIVTVWVPRAVAETQGADTGEPVGFAVSVEGSRKQVEAGGSLLDSLGGFGFGIGHEFFVGAFEVVDFAVAEMPDPRSYFIDDIVVVGDQEDGAVVALE